MFKKLRISILVFLLVLLVSLIYFGTPSLKLLTSSEIIKITQLAEDGNLTAMQRLMVHYDMSDNKEQAKYWHNRVIKLENQKLQENTKNISLIEVIANPDKYHNQHIRVIGFASLKFENQVLYISSSDYEHGISKNGVWLDIDDFAKYRNFDEKYILIEGVFDSKSKGHLGMNTGSIKNIDRIKLWK